MNPQPPGLNFRGDLLLVDPRGRKASKKLPYGSISQFVDDLAVYEDNERLGYIDTEGRVVITARFTRAENFHQGLAKVETESGSACIGRIVWKAPK